jgi:hypothetical protein
MTRFLAWRLFHWYRKLNVATHVCGPFARFLVTSLRLRSIRQAIAWFEVPE